MVGSVCTRCGKPRIVVDSYEEKTETSVVTYTITECSDPECQKIVNKGLAIEKDKRIAIKKDQEEREEERKRHAKRKSIKLGSTSKNSR